MDRVFYEGKTKNKIEIFMLFVYSVYNLVMVALSVENGWDSLVSLGLLAQLSLSWIICLAKVGDFTFRAKFVAIMMQLTLILYMFNLKEIWLTIPVFIGITVFMGLYGIPEIVGYSVVSASIMFLYHGFVAKTIPCSELQDIIDLFIQVGNVYFIIFIIYMWTARNKEGSDRLVGVIKELKNVERSKDDFLANVSHEIRTPINTICGISEIILKEDLPDTVKDDVRGMQVAGRNLMAVVRDILDFSELQSGKIELEEEAYNIASTINDVINMSLARINDKNIELIVDCNADIPSTLLGDEKKIRRIIMNLVDNAIKFTNEGCVSLKIAARKEEYGINLIICVRDTGIGMDEEYMERLFIGFNQADISKKSKEGGVGLGLPITYQLSKKLGAAITMKSEVGKGSEIQVVIPQKVLDEQNIASLHNKKNINVAVYIDFEQFDMVQIRDEYSKGIIHMAEQLRGRCHICKNFPELQRREEREKFSHIFISIVEYKADQEYFDELALHTKVVVVLYRSDEKHITNPNILKIYKPFYILTIVAVLNGLYDKEGEVNSGSTKKFITRDVKVLVVDDNRMNIRVIEGLLADYNVKVDIALSGREALDIVDGSDYDFIFMDHMMPGMDGIETLHHIRQKAGTYYQRIPIIALTANAVAGTREMFIQNGFNDFMEKPVERSVLERVLKRNIAPDKIIYGQMEDEEITKKDLQEINVEDLESLMTKKGIDVKKGIVYCGGKDGYIDVVKNYCSEYKTASDSIEKLYDKQDWKTYTIEVHAIKSAMKSIGAMSVSDKAAKLEMAGLKADIDYILANHKALVDEYVQLFEDLRNDDSGLFKCEELSKEEEVVEDIQLTPIDKQEFDELIINMENAMYDLDGEFLKQSVEELRHREYMGESLTDKLSTVVRKIEMSDYMSAVDVVIRIKEEIEGKEE